MKSRLSPFVASSLRPFVAAVVCFAGAAMVSSGCGGKTDWGRLAGGGINALRSQSMDERDEKQLGRTVALQLTNKHPLTRDDSLNDYVSMVGLTIASKSPRPDMHFVFGVLDTPQVGAWAGPSGYIMVTRGALAMMQDESELAGVLAHEMAHAIKQHGLEAVKQQGLMSGLLEMSAANQQGARAVGAMGQAADALISKPYSRDQETVADTEAVSYLVKAGYAPDGLLLFLKRLEKSQGRGTGSGQMFSTHPGLDQRVANVSSLIARAHNPAGATNQARFRQMTAQVH